MFNRGCLNTKCDYNKNKFCKINPCEILRIRPLPSKEVARNELELIEKIETFRKSFIKTYDDFIGIIASWNEEKNEFTFTNKEKEHFKEILIEKIEELKSLFSEKDSVTPKTSRSHERIQELSLLSEKNKEKVESKSITIYPKKRYGLKDTGDCWVITDKEEGSMKP